MTVIVTGLSPLLNMCSSGIIPKTETIHYLEYQNTWSADWFAGPDNRVAQFARQIAGALGYEIVILGPYKWYCSPDRIEYEEPDVRLGKENVISENALLFLKSQLRGKSIEIFPEGASCFSRVSRHGVFFRKWKSICYHHLAEIKNRYKVDKYWLLPDHDGNISKKIDYNNKFEVLSTSNLYKGYDLATNFFITRYPEIDFSFHQNAFFHPIVEQIDPSDYILWLDALKEIIGESALILKYKPRSSHHLTRKIADKNIIFVPDKFSILPGEVIIRQSKMNYIGLLSSLVLAFPMDRVHLIPAPDENARVRNERSHSHLADILRL
ncbi:hypothetical protein HKCCA1058_05855 [Rhodobacterales bacterium HKCCA1058]|nr:hypothetical protein [Rhodobacterales bacterium HKCCA1058]